MPVKGSAAHVNENPRNYRCIFTIGFTQIDLPLVVGDGDVGGVLGDVDVVGDGEVGGVVVDVDVLGDGDVGGVVVDVDVLGDVISVVAVVTILENERHKI